MATPKFKVGDKVRVKIRTGSPEHYPFSFVPSMVEMAGEVFTIMNFYSDRYDIQNYKRFSDQPDPGDGYRYDLDGKAACFSWSSPMLEKVDDDPTCFTPKWTPSFIDPFRHTLATEALKAEIDKKMLESLAIPKTDASATGLTSPWISTDMLGDISSYTTKADMASEEPGPEIKPINKRYHHKKFNYVL